MLKCPKISFMHTNFQLHLLKEMDIVVEGDIFHHFSCFENSYQIRKDSDTTELSNCACINFEYSSHLQKLIENSKKSAQDKDKITMENNYLSHKQLCDKMTFHADKRKLCLQALNLRFKYSKLSSTLKLHQKLLLTIPDNNIPCLRGGKCSPSYQQMCPLHSRKNNASS